MSELLVTSLRDLLAQQADRKTQDWWNGYVKDGAPFMGVKMPAIRVALRGWHEANVVDQLDLDQQVDLALALFGGAHSEEKLAATLFLAEILLPAGAIECQRDLGRFAGLFADGQIYDWNVCDWFCVKVLGLLIQRQGRRCARQVSAWRSARNVWQARASLVAFVKVADDRAYDPMIEASCRVLIGREERFAKTAVGWILREISRHDEGLVKRFVSEHISLFTSESLGNAVKYFDKGERKTYRR